MQKISTWAKKHKILTLGCLLVALIIIVAIKSGGKNPSKPLTESNTAPVAVVLTGYGALQQDWNKHHQQDPNYAKNEAYNPTPGLGTDSAHTDKYYALNTSSGRVTSYQMRLPNGQPLAAAQQEVMKEFPSDASILWQNAVSSDPTNSCYLEEIKSPTLGKVLGGKAFGDPQGEVLVELSTATLQTANDNSYYSPSNVNRASLQFLVYQTAADDPAC